MMLVKQSSSASVVRSSGEPRHWKWTVPLGWLIVAAAFFGAWEWSVRIGALNPIYVGQPSRAAKAFIEGMSGPLLTTHAVDTFTGALAGWALASALAIVVALALAASPYLLRVFNPFFTAMNSLPRVALAPILLLWFGIGMQSKIALAFSLAFFVVFSNTIAGIDSADGDHLLLSRVLGASKRETFMKFVLPGAVPSIFTGLELGFIFGILATVAGEMVAGQTGLGVRLTYFASSFQMNNYIAALVIMVIGTMFLTSVLRRVRTGLLRWQVADLGRR